MCIETYKTCIGVISYLSTSTIFIYAATGLYIWYLITKILHFLYHKYLIIVALTILPYLYINTICKKRIFTVHISLLNEVKLSIMQEVRRKFVRKCMKRRNEKCFSNNNIEIWKDKTWPMQRYCELWTILYHIPYLF